MSAAFTPGPWMAAASPSSIVGWPVVRQGVGRSICSVSYLPRETDAEVYAESEANARLIAAAPDLLDAVEGLLEQFVDPQQGLDQFASAIVRKAVERAQAALAKARGEA